MSVLLKVPSKGRFKHLRGARILAPSPEVTNVFCPTHLGSVTSLRSISCLDEPRRARRVTTRPPSLVSAGSVVPPNSISNGHSATSRRGACRRSRFFRGFNLMTCRRACADRGFPIMACSAASRNAISNPGLFPTEPWTGSRMKDPSGTDSRRLPTSLRCFRSAATSPVGTNWSNPQSARGAFTSRQGSARRGSVPQC